MSIIQERAISVGIVEMYYATKEMCQYAYNVYHGVRRGNLLCNKLVHSLGHLHSGCWPQISQKTSLYYDWLIVFFDIILTAFKLFITTSLCHLLFTIYYFTMKYVECLNISTVDRMTFDGLSYKTMFLNILDNRGRRAKPRTSLFYHGFGQTVK